MEADPIKKSKERVVVYLDPALNTWLRTERAKTRKSVSSILEDLAICQIGARARITGHDMVAMRRVK